MTSLVSDFIINPVIRQARRFSAGFGSDAEPASPSRRILPDSDVDGDHAISETEEDVMHFDGSVTVPSANGRSLVAFSQPARTLSVTPLSSGASTGDGVGSPMELAPSSPIDGSSGIQTARDAMTPSSRQDGSPARRNWWIYGRIPEDDGRKEMRQRILAIQNMDIPPSGKARLMHQLLMEDFARSQAAARTELAPKVPVDPPILPQPPLAAPGALESLKFWHTVRDSTATPEFFLTDKDLQRTFAPLPRSSQESGMGMDEDTPPDVRPLGCEHYRRNVKLQCAECGRWYTCRFCHDTVESHTLPRKLTKHMLCMLCGTAQKASDTCSKCGELAARYFCNVCKLWNDDPNKSVYHCGDCGICRIGKGVGKDFYHCKRCIACIAIETETTHKCIERSTDCDCPICGDYMFTSPRTVIFMKCGHSIHEGCWQEYLRTSYKCPICSKSTVNMETQFRNLDIAIDAQPMPKEFENCRAIVLCNDCCAKSATLYHWLGLKCAVCNSYNTSQLRIFTEAEVARNPSLLQGFTMPSPSSQQQQGGRQIGPGRVEGVASPGAAILAGPSVPRQSSLPHSGSLLPRDAPTRFSPLLLPARLARSASPTPPASGLLSANPVESTDDAHEDEEEDTDEEDMIDFWGREESRNITSAESANGTGSQADSDGDGDSADCDDDADHEDDDDDEEDEDIALFGHR